MTRCAPWKWESRLAAPACIPPAWKSQIQPCQQGQMERVNRGIWAVHQEVSVSFLLGTCLELSHETVASSKTTKDFPDLREEGC